MRRSPCRWADDGSGEPGWESVLASFSLVSLCNLSQVSPRALAKWSSTIETKKRLENERNFYKYKIVVLFALPESPVTLTVDGILLAAPPSREDESLVVVKLEVDDDEDDGDDEANRWV